MLELSTPIKFVKRVGERVAAELAKRGVETVEDLLYHLPFRYEDRLNPLPMSALEAGTMASVIGEVRGSVLLRTRHMPLFEMTVGQGLNTVKCMWFHGAYLQDKFQRGADGGAVREAGAFAVECGQVQDDSAAVRDSACSGDSLTRSFRCWRWADCAGV